MGHEIVTVYGIPSCGTVKKARKWLDDHGVDHRFVDFRAEPVQRERVDRWVRALGAAALKNTSGGSYRALPDAKKDWTDPEWAERFAADPMLIKRPVVEVGEIVVMAGFRDPAVLEAALP